MEKAPVLCSLLLFYYIIGTAEACEKEIVIFISNGACEAQCVAV